MNKHIVKALLNLAETSFERCFKISLPGRFSKYGKLNMSMTDSEGILTFCGIMASELMDCDISSGEQIFASRSRFLIMELGAHGCIVDSEQSLFCSKIRGQQKPRATSSACAANAPLLSGLRFSLAEL